MDAFDYTDKPFGEKSRRPDLIWNILTIVVLVTILCLVGYFLMIFVNPHTSFNPLQPPTPLQPLLFPTATITPLQLEPTWTSTATIQPTPSGTPRPTWTPIFTDTPFSLIPPTKTPRPIATSKSKLPFAVSVTHIDSTIIHPEAGCNWLGIGGEALDLNDSPVLYLLVRIGGTLGGEIIDPKLFTTVTIADPRLKYGGASFEFVLGSKPTTSNNTLWIQLMNQAGIPLSEKTYFSTYDDCKRNLVLIRFKQVK